MILEIESGSIRPHSVGNSIWKMLRTCRKADYWMNGLHQDAIRFPIAAKGHTGDTRNACDM